MAGTNPAVVAVFARALTTFSQFTREQASQAPPTGRAHHLGGRLVRVWPACTTHTLPDREMRSLLRRITR